MSLGLLLALASEGVVVSAARGRFTSEVAVALNLQRRVQALIKA